MSQNKVVYIGCHSGFWGDSSKGASQLVKKSEKLDYLVGDYLAEVTMGILARLKKQSSSGKGGMGSGGYVVEYVKDVFAPLMKEIVSKNIKVITNAGGMNPLAMKKDIEALAEKANIKLTVAAIEGDDLSGNFSQLRESIQNFSIEEEKENLPTDKTMLSSNAYLGAFPIAEALAKGAQVVITGRCVDSALVLGPLIYEFGWKPTDYDLLSAGSVTGHLIECGCQATGGNFTDWELSYNHGWGDVGYPIAECHADGSCVITKPPGTGGIVSTATVAEQLVYEIHDPANYILPDVIVDFTNVKLEELSQNTKTQAGRVKVSGAKGRSPTDLYKVSLTYFGGFKLQALLMIGGVDAKRKAEATAYSIIERTRNFLKEKGMPDYEDIFIETLGAEHSYGPHSRTTHSREVLLRIVCSHSDKRALDLLAKEITPSALSMAPGITGGGSGRPQAQPDLLYRSCLVKKDKVPVTIHVGNNQQAFTLPQTKPNDNQTKTSRTKKNIPPALPGTTVTVPLITVCHGRSGDKGDTANIGIVCRDAKFLPYVEQQLTEERVKEYLSHLVKGKVVRYVLEGINAFNFVCTEALGGGGLSSFRMDRQGKCYAQMLLDYQIEVPYELLQKSKL